MRRRDKIKILHWDHNGFCLYYRRLEKGRFQWPTTQEHGTLTISRHQLQWLLDGLALDQPKLTGRCTPVLSFDEKDFGDPVPAGRNGS